jgi:hypothetical protein
MGTAETRNISAILTDENKSVTLITHPFGTITNEPLYQFNRPTNTKDRQIFPAM